MSKPLQNDLEGLRTARRGDYRILFTLDKSAGILLVIRIGHRAHIYGPASQFLRSPLDR